MATKQNVPKASEESDVFYHRLLTELDRPAYTCDMFGYLKSFNQAAANVWGIEPELGNTKWCGSWKIFHPNGSRIHLDECPMAIIIKEGRVISEEVIVERQDGKRFNIIPHPNFIKDSDGVNVGAINIFEDITLLRIAEQKLQESIELRFEGVEHFRKDILKSKSVSLQLEKEVEEKASELKRVNIELVFQNNRVAELALTNLELVFQNGEEGKRATELIKANDELAFQNEEKGKRAAELAIANEELAFQIGEKGKRAAELILANKELVFQNEEKEKRAAELVIANRELVLQNIEKEKRAAELVIANHELAFQNTEKGKRAAELILANKELVFQNEEKEKRAAELVIANGELVLRNIEKEKRAAELVIANQELAFQNTEKGKRAAELIVANEELAFQNIEKEKRASELVAINAELETFSYVSSHDLQEPLRKIQILSNLLLEIENSNLTEQGKDYLKRMRSAASRMRTLIDDLLAFSRLDLIERKFEDTDLTNIVEEVKSELKETIDESNVTLEYTNLCNVKIIPFQFRQIMHNLINNAVKFARPGLPPHIIITTRIVKGVELNEEKLNTSTEYCHISVSDNGIGFDPQYKDLIFKAFKRLHGAEKYTGSGIGLAIVKKVVDNHNGIINATGILNHGATFNIYIPVSSE